MKWLTGELAPAREIDVFAARVTNPGNGRNLDAVLDEVRRIRSQAFGRARAAVDLPRFRELLIDVACWIECGTWRHVSNRSGGDPCSATVVATASEQLGLRVKKICRRGAKLDQLDPRERHKLRLAVKKLRYATDFFAGLFPGKKSKRRRIRFIRALKELQDCLGRLNDIGVNEKIAAGFAADVDKTHGATSRPLARKTGSQQSFAAGRLFGREEAVVNSVMKSAKRGYIRFAHAKPYWT